MEERMFDLEEAERLLPQIELCLKAALKARQEIEKINREYLQVVREVSSSGGRRVDISKAIARKQEKETWVARFGSTLQEIEDTGCLLKDLDAGLVDFPCEFAGREIYLCWKLDEPTIAFWHDPEDGFAGRKPIDAEFLQQIYRSRPN